jgi:hypothetical protein
MKPSSRSSFDTLPSSFKIRDREMPQRLLGVVLWSALLLILWKFGAR